MTQLTEKGSLIAGVVAAIGASVCCVGLLVLPALGIGGSWVGSLTAMEAVPAIFHRHDAAVSRAAVALAMQNMTCELCPITVKRSLEKVPGVSAVKVDFDKKTAIVTYDADKAQPEVLATATTNAGYPSTVQK